MVERDWENISAVSTLTEDRFRLTDPGNGLHDRQGKRERQVGSERETDV